MAAMEGNQTALVEIMDNVDGGLLSRGVNHTDKYGRTPVHYAVPCTVLSSACDRTANMTFLYCALFVLALSSGVVVALVSVALGHHIVAIVILGVIG